MVEAAVQLTVVQWRPQPAPPPPPPPPPSYNIRIRDTRYNTLDSDTPYLTQYFQFSLVGSLEINKYLVKLTKSKPNPELIY